jgi:hypothetical protein
MGVAVNVFIVPVSVAEVHLPDQAAVDEQRQDAINGGLGDLGALVPEAQVEFVHVKVPMNLKNLAQYFFPLRGAAQAPLANIFPEYLNFRFHHRARIKVAILLRINYNNNPWRGDVKQIIETGGRRRAGWVADSH